MRCPLCDSATRVLSSDKILRRRECITCRHRFGTIEIKKEIYDGLSQLQEAVEAVERMRRAQPGMTG